MFKAKTRIFVHFAALFHNYFFSFVIYCKKKSYELNENLPEWKKYGILNYFLQEILFMKLISKMILLMYLCAALNGIAYAGGSISAGITALNLNSCATDVYKQKYTQMPQLSEILSIKNALTNFAQDVPQMQGYDWSKKREENKKLFVFLCEI